MTVEQYHFVNGIRMSHGFAALLRAYRAKDKNHERRQIRRALLRCSPVRRVYVEPNNRVVRIYTTFGTYTTHQIPEEQDNGIDTRHNQTSEVGAGQHRNARTTGQ